MGILDDAIKEHLELKRQRGAAESELQQLEGEAFGAAERPGTEAPDEAGEVDEAPTQFMVQPDLEEAEAPEAEAEALEPEAPAEEESPAIEHEAVVPPEPVAEEPPEPPAAQGPSTEDREAIADQPTEMFDVEEEFDEDDDFWDEKRLSDELDQALEGPADDDDEPERQPPPRDEHDDVLEDTPDFLEESEDDQLWFEQKPPKDFDFDD